MAKPFLFKDIIQDGRFGENRALSLKTGAKNVVTIAGSLLGGKMFSPKKNLKTASLTTAMLDKGTVKHDKYYISEKLENVGATVIFSCSNYHVHFLGHCLKPDLPLVISLIGEQLREPAFLSEELETLKTRLIGNLERAKEDTKKQAAIKFLQFLYPHGHPNRPQSTDESIHLIQNLSTIDLKKYHEETYGQGQLLIAAAGDVEHNTLITIAEDTFTGWKTSSLEIGKPLLEANRNKCRSEKVNIPEKTSADIYLGQAVGIHRDHEDYYPLMLGVYILGGNFSARLMQTVRDNQGLTYGIGSSVAGVSFGNDGYWNIWGTFAPDVLEKGHQATMEQVILWYEKGISEKELASKKTTITGAFKVGLDTTGGLANQVLTNAERYRSNDYLDKFPEIIKSVTCNRVNRTIQKYINPETLTFVAAGTLNDIK